MPSCAATRQARSDFTDDGPALLPPAKAAVQELRTGWLGHKKKPDFRRNRVSSRAGIDVPERIN
jgi:hypothetical protein